MTIPKFTSFASERTIQQDLTKARVHAITNRVIWSAYETTAYEALRQVRKADKQFRVFPTDNHEQAQQLAKVLA